jgi:hypothetical protein
MANGFGNFFGNYALPSLSIPGIATFYSIKRNGFEHQFIPISGH